MLRKRRWLYRHFFYGHSNKYYMFHSTARRRFLRTSNRFFNVIRFICVLSVVLGIFAFAAVIVFFVVWFFMFIITLGQFTDAEMLKQVWQYAIYAVYAGLGGLVVFWISTFVKFIIETMLMMIEWRYLKREPNLAEKEKYLRVAHAVRNVRIFEVSLLLGVIITLIGLLVLGINIRADNATLFGMETSDLIAVIIIIALALICGLSVAKTMFAHYAYSGVSDEIMEIELEMGDFAPKKRRR